MAKIKIILADDHRLFREGLRFIIESHHDLKVISEVSNGADLISRIREEKPDVVLMDLKMPVMDGIEAIRNIRSEQWNIRLIVMSMHDEDTLISHLYELGADSFLLKNTSATQIISEIRKFK